MQYYLKTLLLLIMTVSTFNLIGQGSVKGLMQDAGNKGNLSGVLVEIQGTDFYAQTNSSGAFEIKNVPYGEYTIQFSAEGYAPFTKDIATKDGTLDMGIIEMVIDGGGNADAEDIIPTIMLSDEDIESGSSGTQSISGVLNASRDVFSSKVAFAWGLQDSGCGVIIQTTPLYL